MKTTGTKTATPWKTVKKVSVPTLTILEGVPTVVRFLTPFILAPERSGPSVVGDQEKKPPMVARVIPYDYDSGAEMTEHAVVGGTVLVSTLEEGYPDGGYVGRTFEIVKQPTGEGRGGKRGYFRYWVTEVESAL